MRLPQFTAEASLGKTSESYTLTPGAPAEAGGVLPQAYSVRQSGDGVDITICDGGACTTLHVRTHYTAV